MSTFIKKNSCTLYGLRSVHPVLDTRVRVALGGCLMFLEGVEANLGLTLLMSLVSRYKISTLVKLRLVLDQTSVL